MGRAPKNKHPSGAYRGTRHLYRPRKYIARVHFLPIRVAFFGMFHSRRCRLVRNQPSGAYRGTRNRYRPRRYIARDHFLHIRVVFFGLFHSRRCRLLRVQASRLVIRCSAMSNSNLPPYLSIHFAKRGVVDGGYAIAYTILYLLSVAFVAPRVSA